MRVSEIFLSIEGEGIRAGLPSVFVRLHGCNLRCSYCDSMYAVEGDDFSEMSVSDIVEAVNQYRVGRVTLTGGEPLIHKDVESLVLELLKNNEVNIETNGSVDLYDILDAVESAKLRDKLIITMDWKSVHSEESNRMVPHNILNLESQDVLKFVVGSEVDLRQMQDVLEHEGTKTNCNVFVSPVFGEIDPATIVDYVLKYHMNDVRVQLQIHKMIWDPNKRGV